METQLNNKNTTRKTDCTPTQETKATTNNKGNNVQYPPPALGGCPLHQCLQTQTLTPMNNVTKQKSTVDYKQLPLPSLATHSSTLSPPLQLTAAPSPLPRNSQLHPLPSLATHSCASEVCVGECSEPLLSCSIPGNRSGHHKIVELLGSYNQVSPFSPDLGERQLGITPQCFCYI